MSTQQSENARKLLLRILRHPEELDMQTWFRQTSCGTTACLAGHASLMMGWEPDASSRSLFFDPRTNRRKRADLLGQEFLELDYGTAFSLFYDADNCAALSVLDRAAEGERITDELVSESIEDARDFTVEYAYRALVKELQDKYLPKKELESMREASKSRRLKFWGKD